MAAKTEVKEEVKTEVKAEEVKEEVKQEVEVKAAHEVVRSCHVRTPFVDNLHMGCSGRTQAGGRTRGRNTAICC